MDRRHIFRWQINRQAQLKLEQAVDEALCRVKDISCKGAGVILGVKLPQNTAFRLNLKLAQDCSFEAEAWVVWAKAIGGINHYGLYFSKIKDADKEKISHFVNTCCPNEVTQNLWSGSEITGKAKGGEDMDDHRIFERFQRNLPARFIDIDSGREGSAQTLDASARGLGLTTNYELKPHAALEIWLDISGSKEPFYTRGEVVWSRPEGSQGYRAGIELEKADLMGISRLLRV